MRNIFLPLLVILISTFVRQAYCQELKQGFYPSGKLRYEGIFVNGQPVGELTRYYESGQVQAKLNHRGDTVDAVLYSRNGDYTSSGKYVTHKKWGIWKYFKGERLLGSDEYYDDLLSGESLRYSVEGKIVECKHWHRGKAAGTWILYYQDGQVRMQTFYVDGKLNGLLKSYSREGQMTAKGVYRDDLKEGVWEFYGADGKLIATRVYEHGVPEGKDGMELEESRKLDALIESAGQIPDPALFMDDPEAYMKISGAR